MDLEKRLRVPESGFRLADCDPGERLGMTKDGSAAIRERQLEQLDALQERLYAEGRRALLVVFQAMDAAGKDGTIEHVMSGVNPQGVRVTSFKQPSSLELSHDWLWRCSAALPARGEIGIFNRSHYEEVLVVRVHPDYLAGQSLDPAKAGQRFWKQRLEDIAAWERHLTRCGTQIVKFFLNVSREEQRERFLSRATEDEKHWKFSAADVREREHWDEYQAAYDEALRHTSTEDAPWYVIPADHKWAMRTAVASIIVHHLERMDPQFPVPSDEELTAMKAAVAELQSER
jgi:PPK2 family polyphosphate:nucleotide phosphotransferase